MPFRFNTLLEDAEIDPAQVRLLRHLPRVGGRALLDAWRADRTVLEEYQSLQLAAKRAHFAHPYWASFAGTWDGRTVFIGLYSVGAPAALTEPVTLALSGNVNAPGEHDRYPTTRIESFERYEGRVYIDWGGGSSGKKAWVQRAYAQNKLVTELHLTTAEQPFPGYLALSKPLSELGDAPPHWIERLASAKGVYLLTCPRDGSLYVGSAAGDGGFWSRWSEYRANGHGGNLALRNRERSDYSVSILQVAGSSDTLETIVAAEQIWKGKLKSREFQLDLN